MISSDFLKIEELTSECIEYVTKNIEKIAKLTIDMSCMSSHLIRAMASKLSIETIDELKERKDKLVSKLFMKKLEILLEDLPKNALYRCVRCNQILPGKFFQNLECAKAEPRIDALGRLRVTHLLEHTWETKKFINFVRETYRISWREIFWKVWSHLNGFWCRTCNKFFLFSQISSCTFHPKKAWFDRPNQGL
jgi:hypothetical protein